MIAASSDGTRSTEFLERPGGRVAYETVGSGPLVVAAPGMGDLRSVYRRLAPDLAEEGFRLASMDLRGHGESDATFAAYDDVAVGEDLVALLRHLGEPAALIGNSMSAGAAVWATAEAPELVRGLVLIGPFVRNTPIGLASLLAFRLALMRPWGPRAWTAYYRTLYPGRAPEDLDAHREAIARSLRRPGHWRAFVAATHGSHAPAEARLGQVRAPALVVMGTRDPDFKDPRAEASFVAERLRGEVLMVPDAGHYPQAEFPEIVGPAVVRFLKEACANAAG